MARCFSETRSQWFEMYNVLQYFTQKHFFKRSSRFFTRKSGQKFATSRRPSGLLYWNHSWRENLSWAGSKFLLWSFPNDLWPFQVGWGYSHFVERMWCRKKFIMWQERRFIFHIGNCFSILKQKLIWIISSNNLRDSNQVSPHIPHAAKI